MMMTKVMIITIISANLCILTGPLLTHWRLIRGDRKEMGWLTFFLKSSSPPVGVCCLQPTRRLIQAQWRRLRDGPF